jgi:NTE family protein
LQAGDTQYRQHGQEPGVASTALGQDLDHRDCSGKTSGEYSVIKHLLPNVTLSAEPSQGWLHLLDGGISDNPGLRAFYNTLGMLNDPRGSVPSLLDDDVRNIIIISVNAHANHHPHLALTRYAPSLSEVISSVTSEQMSRYSQDTIQIVRYQYENLACELSTPGKQVNFYFVEVSFNQLQDKDQREYFNSIATNFDLNEDEVDKLVTVAGSLLRESPEFQSLLLELAPREADQE